MITFKKLKKLEVEVLRVHKQTGVRDLYIVESLVEAYSRVQKLNIKHKDDDFYFVIELLGDEEITS